MGDQIIVEVPAGAVLHHDVDMVGILRDFVHVNDERAPAGEAERADLVADLRQG